MSTTTKLQSVRNAKRPTAKTDRSGGWDPGEEEGFVKVFGFQRWAQPKPVEQWPKPSLFRVYTGWNTSQLYIYRDYLISHYKEPYQPTSIMEYQPGFYVFFHVFWGPKVKVFMLGIYALDIQANTSWGVSGVLLVCFWGQKSYQTSVSVVFGCLGHKWWGYISRLTQGYNYPRQAHVCSAIFLGVK